MTQIKGIKLESTVHLIDMCCASRKRKYLVKMEFKITLMGSDITRAFLSRGKYFRVEKSEIYPELYYTSQKNSIMTQRSCNEI
jgi:hypothetical protein